MNPQEEWLKEIKESARSRYSSRFDEFCEWIQKTPEQLVEEHKATTDKEAWAKKWGSIITQYYQARLGAGYKVNSARTDTISPRSFFKSQCQEVKIAREGEGMKGKGKKGERKGHGRKELKKPCPFPQPSEIFFAVAI